MASRGTGSGALGSAPVLLLGSGLTMVDVLFGLRGRGLHAPAYAVSRHGLLPAIQQPMTPPPACLPPERYYSISARDRESARLSADHNGSVGVAIRSPRAAHTVAGGSVP